MFLWVKLTLINFHNIDIKLEAMSVTHYNDSLNRGRCLAT